MEEVACQFHAAAGILCLLPTHASGILQNKWACGTTLNNAHRRGFVCIMYTQSWLKNKSVHAIELPLYCTTDAHMSKLKVQFHPPRLNILWLNEANVKVVMPPCLRLFWCLDLQTLNLPGGYKSHLTALLHLRQPVISQLLLCLVNKNQ